MKLAGRTQSIARLSNRKGMLLPASCQILSRLISLDSGALCSIDLSELDLILPL